MAQCVERVRGHDGWRSHQCTRVGRVQRGEDWYCGQHDPEKRRATKEAAQVRWQAESRYKTARGDVLRKAIEYANTRDDTPLLAAVAEMNAATAQCVALGIATWRLG